MWDSCVFTLIHQVLPACVSAHVERACLVGVLLSAPEYTGHWGGGGQACSLDTSEYKSKGGLKCMVCTHVYVRGGR